MVTDQTSAHDLVYGYLPAGWTVERWHAAQRIRRSIAALVAAAKGRSSARRGDARVSRAGHPDVRLRQQHPAGRARRRRCRRVRFPGFVPAYIRPLFCEGKGPFRWVALSGDPEDIAKTDRKVQELFPAERIAAALARPGRRAHRVPGVARAHLLAGPRRAAPPGSRSTRWSRAAN